MRLRARASACTHTCCAYYSRSVVRTLPHAHSFRLTLQHRRGDAGEKRSIESHTVLYRTYYRVQRSTPKGCPSVRPSNNVNAIQHINPAANTCDTLSSRVSLFNSRFSTVDLDTLTLNHQFFNFQHLFILAQVSVVSFSTF